MFRTYAYSHIHLHLPRTHAQDPVARPAARTMLKHPFVKDTVESIMSNGGSSPLLQDLVDVSMERIEKCRMEMGQVRRAFLVCTECVVNTSEEEPK